MSIASEWLENRKAVAAAQPTFVQGKLEASLMAYAGDPGHIDINARQLTKEEALAFARWVLEIFGEKP